MSGVLRGRGVGGGRPDCGAGCRADVRLSGVCVSSPVTVMPCAA